MRTLILDVQNAFIDVLLAKDTLALAEAIPEDTGECG